MATCLFNKSPAYSGYEWVTKIIVKNFGSKIYLQGQSFDFLFNI